VEWWEREVVESELRLPSGADRRAEGDTELDGGRRTTPTPNSSQRETKSEKGREKKFLQRRRRSLDNWGRERCRWRAGRQTT
jgi:hypothetical protein